MENRVDVYYNDKLVGTIGLINETKNTLFNMIVNG